MYIDSNESIDDDTPNRKCFDVEIPDEFDPNRIPTTGEEYLQLAMYEAKKYKSIVSVTIDPKKLKSHTDVIEKKERDPDVQKLFLPLSWKNKRLVQFTRFYNYIQEELETIPPKFTCFLEDYWMHKLNDFPTYSDAIRLDAYNQLCLLNIISKELQYIQSGTTMTDVTGCWIYTILSLLQIPLTPALHGVLREVALRCFSIRSKLSTNFSSEKLETLNVLICIIGVFYKQYDLSDQYYNLKL